jgi:hypothetical protein
MSTLMSPPKIDFMSSERINDSYFIAAPAVRALHGFSNCLEKFQAESGESFQQILKLEVVSVTLWEVEQIGCDTCIDKYRAGVVARLKFKCRL